MALRFSIVFSVLLAAGIAGCGSPTEPDVPSEPLQIVVTATPPRISQQNSSALPTPTLIALPVSSTIFESYTVRSGDTLGGIAARNEISVDDLMKLNGLANPHALQIGQVIKIPLLVPRVGPPDILLPDSEAVYGPGYASFDVGTFAAKMGGYLFFYREKVDGETLTGPQVIQLVAERYSVGPRLLLALLEHQGRWVSSGTVTQNQLSYPMGIQDSGRTGLFLQASIAANRLNEGYYGRLTGRLTAYRFKDRSRARLAPSVNPGTAAIENMLASVSSWDNWLYQISPNGFIATYRRLFGEPSAYAVSPVVPINLKQPTMRLPWNNGNTWYYTGGPHSAWGDWAAWAAIDLTPGDLAGSGSCNPSRDWVISASPGKVIRAEHGRVMVSLGKSNFQGSGWAVMYMHIASGGRVAPETLVNPGDRIGHASCEGGDADASHLHFARLYNGQWIDPETVPFVLSDWRVTSLDQQYDGKMIRGNDSREALNGRDDGKNGLLATPPK